MSLVSVSENPQSYSIWEGSTGFSGSLHFCTSLLPGTLSKPFKKKKLAAISPSIVFFMMRRNSSCNTVVSPKMVGTHRNSSNTRNSEKKQFAIENPDFFLINTISNGGFFSLLYELIPECQMSILVHKEHQETLRFVGK